METLTYDRLLERLALEHGQATAASVDERVRALQPSVDPHALTSELVRQLEPCGPSDGVLLDLLDRWCRFESPSRDNLLSLARMAAGACAAAAPIDRALTGALRELGQGVPLTATQAWADFVREPTYEHRAVFVHLLERQGLAGLVSCAKNVETDSRLRDIAADLLARKAANAQALGLQPDTIAEIGRAMTSVFLGARGDDIPGRFHWIDGFSTWVHTDPEGAERIFDEEVRRSGHSSYHLRRALAGVSRPKARKVAWCARVRALVLDELSQHGRLDAYVLSIWLTLAPAECYAWLASLDMALLPDAVRQQIAGTFNYRPSPESRRVLERIIATSGGGALTAETILSWHDDQARKAAMRRVSALWSESQSAAALRQIYADHLRHLAPGTLVNDWMARLGAKGRRTSSTFRAADAPHVSLFVDIDGRGRLRTVRLDE